MENDKNNKQPEDRTALSPQRGPVTGKGAKKALTEIDTSFHSSHTVQGFANAKKNADKALAENQIILNHRFVLKETLGAGGMGTVYKAQDLRKVEAQDIQPYVAAKILNNDFRNHPDAFISLQREASRSHLLSHPNIVTVHDFDRDGDTIFMTMELLDGQDLESLLKNYAGKGMEQSRALEIFKDFCTALKFAHKKGIIHSDFKPGNIFVTKDEGTKVLDFGIARLALESKNKDHFDAGRIGAITPAYASLEMIGHKPPDPRDDVYAASIIAYELLSGKHPYQGKSAAVALVGGLKPAKLDSLTKRQWQALEKGLQLKREDRIGSIDELMEGLLFKPKLPIFRVVTMVLVGVIGWFIYNQFFAPNPLSKVIEETFSKAQSCYQDGNFQCAIESANAILEIAPEHQQAIELGREAAIKQALFEIDTCLNMDESISCALAKLDELTILQPSSQLLDTVNKSIAKKTLELKVAKLVEEAQKCFQAEDFKCSEKNSEQALSLSSTNENAIQLLSDSQSELAKLKVVADKKNDAYEKLFNKANLCFKQANLGCAKSDIENALKILPEKPEAVELHQHIKAALDEQQKNLKKADKIIKDGRLCLKKLNFSCALAKSDAALDFVPGYKKALQLKRDATKSLNKVKKKIEIN